nr:acetolactate synthase large subunit [Lachnospiraceae bacterium]
ARTGRPGPVLVDVTKDVTAAKADFKQLVVKENVRITDTIREEDIDKACAMIKAAKKPVVFVGGGAVISGANKELKAFVERIDAPVCDTLMGKGAFSGEHPYYMGMLGMHGTKTANLTVTDCDLLVVLGARFSDRVTGNAKKFASKAKILHIDVDPAEVNKNIHVNASIIGDCKSVLEILLNRIDPMKHEEWIKSVLKRKEELPLTYPTNVLTGPYVMEAINKYTKGDCIISTDVGQHQMWAAQFFKYKQPRTLLTSGGLGTMGYGLGACIGAQVGCPDKQVINIAGDGCFRMNMNEIATATRYNIPIIQVIFNNHVLGMVRQWQDLFYGQRYSQTVLNDKVDFVKVSEGMGAKAYRVTEKEEFDKVFKNALKAKEPVVIECVIDSDEKVWPMVAPGAAISEIVDENTVKNK